MRLGQSRTQDMKRSIVIKEFGYVMVLWTLIEIEQMMDGNDHITDSAINKINVVGVDRVHRFHCCRLTM